MRRIPAIGGRLIAFAFAGLSCLFGQGLIAQEFTAAQPRPPESHPGLACASGAERARLQGLLKSWQAAYTQWDSARVKIDKAKPAYEEAQARFEEALAHERGFPNQLVAIMRGSWSPDLFAASARRDEAYAVLHAAAEEGERAFNALQAARSADEQLATEISKRSCSRSRGQPSTGAEPQPQAQPEPPVIQPKSCRQLIVSGAIRCQ